eukprot:scaffold23913_cov45-Prasinocladus_malaysianus.AAC.2
MSTVSVWVFIRILSGLSVGNRKFSLSRINRNACSRQIRKRLVEATKSRRGFVCLSSLWNTCWQNAC